MHFARVYYLRKNSLQVEAGDLYFSRGGPLLVLSWERKNGRRVPGDCVELEADKLTRASSNGTIYRYEGQVAR
jgi:hypothetical protein